jgi:hypothetical protein
MKYAPYIITSILLVFFVVTIAGATGLKQTSADVTAKLSAMKNYSCFAELDWEAANTKWQKPISRYDFPYVLITQDDHYVLIAQPHPQLCDSSLTKECKIFWIRTMPKQEPFVFNINQVPCPKFLNRNFIRRYIKEHYFDDINLNEVP